jgi:hypothetical protein
MDRFAFRRFPADMVFLPGNRRWRVLATGETTGHPFPRERACCPFQGTGRFFSFSIKLNYTHLHFHGNSNTTPSFNGERASNDHHPGA